MRSIILGLLIIVSAACRAQETIDLSGTWTYALDSLDIGENNGWQRRLFHQQLSLPGTLDDAGAGKPADLSVTFEKATLLQLTRKYRYIGTAWYNREVTIPESWAGKTIVLSLERVIWETQVYIDGKKAGMNESLVAPHQFDLTSQLTPGTHLLSIRIDNREKYDVSLDTRNFAHAYTDGTQIIWNGVIGKLELQARDNIYIDDIQVYPDIDAGTVTAKVFLKNTKRVKTQGELIASIEQNSVKQSFKLSGNDDIITLNLNMGKEFKTWDEFDPHLYTLTVQAETGKGKRKTSDTRVVTFGMRKISRDGKILKINNRRAFLRGTLECAIFPLTGYPPMDKAGWKKIFETARSYGLNHLRFHSWCPPEAAFAAADECGFYLQVELPLWSLTVGQDESINRFLKDEAYRIIRAYGNHPSFCLWSMGNELQGEFDWITRLLTELRNTDNRHLYTTTTFTFQKGKGLRPEPVDDFYITQYTQEGWVRGQGIFDTEAPAFDKDYTKATDSISVPLISHEIGQYSVYPNLEEIKKYTGVLAPLNFMAIQEDLKKKNRLVYAKDFTRASGKFAVTLYKEEIERALKTPSFSGFQLLDLHDFPGQGTAIVGILDAFWDSKGLITPEAFRQFCSPVVPLIRYPKAVYTNDETFAASIEVANFGNADLQAVTPVWKVMDNKGNVLHSGKLASTTIPIGNGTSIGVFQYPLNTLQQASALTVEVSLEGTPYRNSWKIWVYPKALPAADNNVIITRSFEEAIWHLSKGKNVLLNPPLDSVRGIEGKFLPVFWSPVHFPDQPGSMGILCDPSHPALQHFPTEEHSEWQWWFLCKKSKPMLLDHLNNVQPVIRVVDNFYKNRNLGTFLEARVGKGKLMLCSIDLSDDSIKKNPVARQLRYSILQYMNSQNFNPGTVLTKDDVQALFQPDKK